jgi:hypothetical protein
MRVLRVLTMTVVNHGRRSTLTKFPVVQVRSLRWLAQKRQSKYRRHERQRGNRT